MTKNIDQTTPVSNDLASDISREGNAVSSAPVSRVINPRPHYVLPVKAEAIPEALKATPRFVTWNAGPLNEKGKFTKVPVNFRTGANVSAHKPANWLTFDTALAAYLAGECHGIGFAPAGRPLVMESEVPLYPCAIDLDGCGGELGVHEALWNSLGQPYVEVSPSGNGLRMFMLSTEVLKGGNAGNGFEMYFDKQFLTVTGQTLGGTLVECTDELKRLHDLKFSEKLKPTSSPKSARRQRPPDRHPAMEETQRNVAWVWDLLSKIDADCDYVTYRNTIWGIEALGWDCGDDLQREWSLTAPHRFDEHTFVLILKSFKPADNHIGFGTVVYLSQGGTKATSEVIV